MEGAQLPQGKNHFKEAVYFLPLSSQKFLVVILSTSEGWKAESILEQPSGFEHRIPRNCKVQSVNLNSDPIVNMYLINGSFMADKIQFHCWITLMLFT